MAAGKLETQAPVAHAPVRNMRLPGNGLCHSHNVANLAQTQRRQACLTEVRHACLSLLVFVGGHCEERCKAVPGLPVQAQAQFVQGLVAGFVVGHNLLDQGPETGAVVEHFEVGHLVYNHIVQHLQR
ncbi:MAG: hypothetical protein KatS3mg069_1800 [Meiothermus sp.]|nr:MAG: hypothetical protein KatS3mg069_1800 [Meiothermus sp.]